MSSPARVSREYLTSRPANDGFALVSGPFAVHDMHVAAPAALLQAIAGTVELP